MPRPNETDRDRRALSQWRQHVQERPDALMYVERQRIVAAAIDPVARDSGGLTEIHRLIEGDSAQAGLVILPGVRPMLTKSAQVFWDS
jgi:hypothetical protein